MNVPQSEQQVSPPLQRLAIAYVELWRAQASVKRAMAAIVAEEPAALEAVPWNGRRRVELLDGSHLTACRDNVGIYFTRHS